MEETQIELKTILTPYVIPTRRPTLTMYILAGPRGKNSIIKFSSKGKN